jgi:FkbM family methyltransferase
MLIRILHPWRFRYRLLGAGNHTGYAELLIPRASSDLSTQASMDPAEFEKEYVQERLASHGHGGAAGDFSQRRVQVTRVDELRLSPDVVKIDVEGWEAQVIEGMQHTLSVHKPMLIIEINNSPRWAPGLETQGYRFYTFENEELLHHADWSSVPGLNMICCHPGSTSAITRHFLPQT